MHPPLRHTLSPDAIPRHLHAAPYAAVVLDGGYEEAGERGRRRVEARARRAWALITGTMDTLASIAAETGFTDQAHMTRDVKALTGKAPGAWRRAG
ncbi:helix-turn-helix domain-containing protein [Caulobacter sp. 1776]|uniref:helix-turn-helix domain-containing protein n=1 Tax=Caulobacter sp. 1776 TaxID=3156420 RepID=UPI00339970B7